MVKCRRLLLLLPPHMAMGLPGPSSIFARILAPFPRPRVARCITPTPEHPSCQPHKQSGNAAKASLECFVSSPLHHTIPCPCHAVTFPPSLTTPNLALNQTIPLPVLAGLSPAVLGCRGKRNEDLPSGFEFSLTRNTANRSLHNCTSPEVKTLRKTKLNSSYKNHSPQSCD